VAETTIRADNLTTVLLIAAVALLITQELRVRPYPFLFAKNFASNAGGTATLIGAPEHHDRPGDEPELQRLPSQSGERSNRCYPCGWSLAPATCRLMVYRRSHKKDAGSIQ